MSMSMSMSVHGDLLPWVPKHLAAEAVSWRQRLGNGVGGGVLEVKIGLFCGNLRCLELFYIVTWLLLWLPLPLEEPEEPAEPREEDDEGLF